MEEFFDVVNKNDRKIGHAPRSHIHLSEMQHRGFHIILFDSRDRIILQKISTMKGKFPSRYGFAVFGHVKSAESYDDAAYKKLYEEMGIKSVKLKRLAKLRLNYEKNDYMISVLYSGKFDGDLASDEDEIPSIHHLSPYEIKKELDEHPEKFESQTRGILRWYMGIASDMEIIENY